jgi:hypothetical protein
MAVARTSRLHFTACIGQSSTPVILLLTHLAGEEGILEAAQADLLAFLRKNSAALSMCCSRARQLSSGQPLADLGTSVEQLLGESGLLLSCEHTAGSLRCAPLKVVSATLMAEKDGGFKGFPLAGVEFIARLTSKAVHKDRMLKSLGWTSKS